MNSEDRKTLLAAAKTAALSAYCPYSKFRVGAAVRGAQGITVGCNVENASYGLTLCAERNALSTAVAAGNTKISAIAVACIDAAPEAGLSELMPCGACRQWIQELAPDAEILIAGTDRMFSIADLLPNPFDLKRR
jgi:cytidine deaminase